MQRPAPEYLYHYTSGPGLYGILSTSTFWGGNYAFMNDRSEFIYGHELLRASLRRAAESTTDSRLRISTDIMSSPIWLRDLSLFLTCFCEAGDLLSQWRGYGSQASRFCLKLRSEELTRQDRISPLTPVVYDEELQKSLLDELVIAHVQILQGLPHEELPERTYDAAMSLYGAVMPLLVAFKSTAFANELEWRFVDLVVGGHLAGSLTFVNADGMMRPYQTLISGSRSSPKLPIVEVIAGAAHDDAQSVASARLMLQSFGYSNVAVTPSRVPLRA